MMTSAHFFHFCLSYRRTTVGVVSGILHIYQVVTNTGAAIMNLLGSSLSLQ